MRGIAQDVEDGGPLGGFRLETNFRIAAANVKDIEVVEAGGFVTDVDRTLASDVQNAELAALA